MRNECNIVRDLLPLYAENMVSEDSAEFIESHLEHCDGCRRELEGIKLNSTSVQTDVSETLPLKGFKRKLNRKLINRIVTALLIGVLCGVLFFGNGIKGNPISFILAKHSAENYIEENAFASGYQIYGLNFSMKDFGYSIKLYTPGSVDNNFTIIVGMFGKVKYSSYDTDVAGRGNVARRVDEDYRKAMNLLLSSKFMNYHPTARLETVPEENKAYAPSYAIIREDLEPDKLYDLYELGAQAGHITLAGVDRDGATYEEAARILLELKATFDENDQAFSAVDLTLTEPESLYEGGLAVNAVYLLGFDFADIYEDGLEERIAEADKQAREILSQPVLGEIKYSNPIT